MEQELKEPTLSSLGIKHLGIFRTGITKSQALLDNRILRILFKRFHRYGVSEGVLAGYVETKKGDPKFQESLARLLEWKMIEFGLARHDDARYVHLAGTGEYWGQELCFAAQTGKGTE